MEGILGRIIATLLGLLALVGLGYASYSGFQNSKANTVVTDISQVITNARTGFAQGNTGYTNFTTANIASLVSAGVFPTDMVRGSSVLDPWGNAVTLASANSGTQGVITFGGGGSESIKACSAVATSLKDYVTLTVGGTSFTQASPPDAATAGTACAAGLGFSVTFQ